MNAQKIKISALAVVAMGMSSAVSSPVSAADGDDVVFPVAIVSGIDLSKKWGEGYLGMYYALNGDLDRSGFILRMLGSGGSFDFRNSVVNGNNVETKYWQGDVLVGYQWVIGGYDFGALMGIDYQDYRLSPFDRTARLRGDEVGFKVALELENNDRSTSPIYLAARGSYSTAFGSYYALGRLGYNFGSMIVGPEIWALGDVSGDGRRVGGFMQFDVPFSAKRFGTLSFSAGYQFFDAKAGDNWQNNNLVGVSGSEGRGSEHNGAYGTIKFILALGRDAPAPNIPLK